ncbi:CSC1-like protein At1g69450 isoform X4 [Phaseolus vulgaris]|uniref:CSC1-like protein At1g69450 isoform X4 n=1 Tax=Phaseolus vulgaris TaxID=3885 RepID=UPI0035CB7424
MIVSALLTSVGINTALCVLFFTLYSILRKQPSNYEVYVPRLLAEGISKRRSRFNLERLIPSAGWVAEAWRLSEEELLSLSGLDGVVFMRMITFRLWVHFSAVYIVTGFTCMLLFFSEAKKLYKRVTQLRSDPSKQKRMNRGISGLFGRKDNVIEEYQKKLEDIEESVRLKQSEASLAGEESRAAFVFFRSRLGAATAFHLKQSVNPTHWITELAPEPRDVYWPFFSESFMRRWISKLVVVFLCTLFTISFLLPVVFVQGLTNLSQLEILFPFLTSMLSIKFFSQIVTGYLPSLILQLFLKVVPPAMKFLSSIQGYISHSDIEMSASRKVLWFTIWNVFFASVFSGSVLSKLSALLDPKNIPGKLAVTVPAQASFFITYVVTQGWTSVSSELFRVIPFIFSWITRPFTSPDDDEFEVPSIPYHKDIPRVLFFGLLGITYFFLAPLILPFLLAYFCLAYIIYRNQFINVYAPKYDTAGKFWPVIHNSMIFSLVLMQIIAVGIFALKKLSMASTLTMPLPVLTLLFNEYCRKRFLPIFVAYSAESLIKKDRQDQNDATMTQFYENLVNAYKDPALLPLQYSPNNDNLRTPLIYQA